MKWIAATNLLRDSQGAQQWLAWLNSQSGDVAAEHCTAVALASRSDYFTATPATERQIEERLAVRLDDALRIGETEGVVAHRVVKTVDSLSAALSAFAEERQSNLIIARRAPRDSDRLVRLGTTARRVIRRMTQPLVVVPSDWRGEHAGKGPVLVAVDPTEASLAAVTFGRKLAALLARPIELVFVLPGIEDFGLIYLASARAKELLREHEESAAKRFDAFVAAHGLADLPAHNARGAIVDALLSRSKEVDATCIVTGSRRLSVGERLLTASVGSDLAATCPQPVVIVPPQD